MLQRGPFTAAILPVLRVQQKSEWLVRLLV
jgi:hypothetical protein